MRVSTNMTRIGLAGLVTALAIVVPAAPAGAAETKAKRCWPAQPTCPAKEYEKKAARAASREARNEFGKDFPPEEWTVVCYPGSSRRKIQCSVHSRDPTPYDCVGGMWMVKRDGRWRAKDIEMSCSG
jgi:hypothetical protein